MMTVKELKKLLSAFPDDMPVVISDRGITRDAAAPINIGTMNGDAVLLDYGNYDARGYVINYSKRYGFEMCLNDSFVDALDNMTDVDLTILRRQVEKEFDVEMGEDGTIDLGNEFYEGENPVETVGAIAPRVFAKERYEMCDKIVARIRETCFKDA